MLDDARLVRCAVGALLVLIGCQGAPARHDPSAANDSPSADAREALEERVRSAMDAEELPGLAVAISDQGTRRFAAAWTAGARVRASTPVRLASMTKTLTATAVLRFVDRGALLLSDPIGAHLDALPAAWRTVTVEQLLRHTSGIVDFTDRDGFDRIEVNDLDPRALLALVADVPPLFRAGSAFRYSNTGYVLLGLLLEKLGGAPYAEVMRREVFDTASMTNAGACADKTDAPAGFARAADGFVPAKTVSLRLPYAAGGLCASMEDLLAFWDAFERGALLSPALAAAMVPTRSSRTCLRTAARAARPTAMVWASASSRWTVCASSDTRATSLVPATSCCTAPAPPPRSSS